NSYVRSIRTEGSVQQPGGRHLEIGSTRAPSSMRISTRTPNIERETVAGSFFGASPEDGCGAAHERITTSFSFPPVLMHVVDRDSPRDAIGSPGTGKAWAAS